jgi:hypothetical protein
MHELVGHSLIALKYSNNAAEEISYGGDLVVGVVTKE